MDPRHIDAEDEQFLLNMIGEGQGDVPVEFLVHHNKQMILFPYNFA